MILQQIHFEFSMEIPMLESPDPKKVVFKRRYVSMSMASYSVWHIEPIQTKFKQNTVYVFWIEIYKQKKWLW